VLLKVPLVESEDNEDPLLGRRVTSEDENDAGVVRAEDVGDVEAPQHHKGKTAHQNAQEVEGMSYTYIRMELLLHIVNRGGYRLHGAKAWWKRAKTGPYIIIRIMGQCLQLTCLYNGL
jgi:hypothetical protein